MVTLSFDLLYPSHFGLGIVRYQPTRSPHKAHVLKSTKNFELVRGLNPGTVRVSTANTKDEVILGSCAVFRPATAESRSPLKNTMQARLCELRERKDAGRKRAQVYPPRYSEHVFSRRRRDLVAQRAAAQGIFEMASRFMTRFRLLLAQCVPPTTACQLLTNM